jgi:hypothetical protein
MSKIISFLFLISSCSFFITRIEKPIQKDPKILAREPEEKNFCPLSNKTHFQLVGSSNNSQVVYSKLHHSLPDLDFLDHFALWSLLQLSIRPDQSSGTSRLQVLINVGEKTHYFDFFSESQEIQYPYLFGIEWVLRKFGKKKSLESYASLLAQYTAGKLKIGKDFESFLLKNLASIKADRELAPYYFRGNDVLKEGETSPTLNYAKILKLFRQSEKKHKIIVNTSLTPFMTSTGLSGSCNYDFNLYDNSIFLIDRVIPVANLFGLATSKGSFLASSSQKMDNMVSLHGLPLFKGESKVRSSAVCMIENSGNKIWTYSNLSRDPGQHLFHLVRYGLPRSESINEVDRLLGHSRHLFLSDPVRLIIESQRSSSEQIENLLKLNLPIYSSDKLGNIWAYAEFPEGRRFIIDGRNPGAYLCE